MCRDKSSLISSAEWWIFWCCLQNGALPLLPEVFRYTVGGGELLHWTSLWKPLWRSWRLSGPALPMWPRLHWAQLLRQHHVEGKPETQCETADMWKVTWSPQTSCFHCVPSRCHWKNALTGTGLAGRSGRCWKADTPVPTVGCWWRERHCILMVQMPDRRSLAIWTCVGRSNYIKHFSLFCHTHNILYVKVFTVSQTSKAFILKASERLLMLAWYS